MPSIAPAVAPEWSLIRSPTLKGRALSSTVPAIRFPIVCWAARPKSTAVSAPPTASVSGLRPAIRSATRIAKATVKRRIRKPSVPAVPGSRRLKRIGPIARPTSRASAQPRMTSATTRGDAHGHVDPEEIHAVLVGEQDRCRGAGGSEALLRGRGARGHAHASPALGPESGTCLVRSPRGRVVNAPAYGLLRKARLAGLLAQLRAHDAARGRRRSGGIAHAAFGPAPPSPRCP